MVGGRRPLATMNGLNGQGCAFQPAHQNDTLRKTGSKREAEKQNLPLELPIQRREQQLFGGERGTMTSMDICCSPMASPKFSTVPEQVPLDGQRRPLAVVNASPTAIGGRQWQVPSQLGQQQSSFFIPGLPSPACSQTGSGGSSHGLAKFNRCSFQSSPTVTPVSTGHPMPNWPSPGPLGSPISNMAIAQNTRNRRL
mmetsp:Transcript_70100/g.135302  ORF Transcript_70100/g.135302 Transcript_70100/m.135302 type:complete len:197 (-) Transcript_70100:163-753(-)